MSGYYDRDRNPVAGTRTTAGTMNHAYAHHSSVSEYQSSGTPFVYTKRFANGDFSTAQAAGIGTNNTNEYVDKVVKINFPFVTRWVMIWCHYGSDYEAATQNNANNIRVGFGYAGTYNASEGGPLNPAVTANTAGDGNWVTTGLCNQVRMELKCKQLSLMIPGSWAPSAANNGGKLTIEIIAGLTSVKDFPSQDQPYVSGITSTDYEGARNAQPWDGSDNPIDFAIHDATADTNLTTVNQGAAPTT